MGQNKMKLYIKQQKVNPPNINTHVWTNTCVQTFFHSNNCIASMVFL